MNTNTPLIQLKDVSYTYPNGKPVLDQVNFTIPRGKRIGLIGPNGSGKTTLFHIIMGLLPANSGAIEIFGIPVKTEKEFQAIRPRIGLLFQDADDQLFSPTVLEDVAFGPLNLNKTPTEAKAIARKTLTSLGMADFEDRITHQLSGGEKRMIAMATVLAMDPEILLLDEPTAGLDEDTKSKLQTVLDHLDLSYIIISHELDFLADVTDIVIMMKDGKVVTEGVVQLHQHHHAHVHGDAPHEH
jgi:cobalt/nickel transport system ATP-binding protein